ncbi:MAG TPA: nitronate monooxygenase [Candidatus Binataceae bacterium]
MSPTRREVIKTVVAVGALPEAIGASRADTSQSVSTIPLPTPRAKALMEVFGLKYPIFEAPHGNQTCPELCIAVANAGAMGSLAAFIFDSDETAHNAVSKVRSATKGNFFVNFVLQFGAKALQATLDAGAPTIEFSWGVPTKAMVAAVRASKAKLGIQVINAESTRVALDLGADFLVCQGTEAGGHVEASRGLYETLSIVLKEAGKTPVIAAGGIGNGEGIYKALAAGASAAALGTRFVATAESTAHPDYKRALVAADAKDTALTICFQDGWAAMHRVLRNRTFTMWETAGSSLPGKRPGEGDVVATQADGTKVVRYEGTAPRPGFVGAVTDCPMWAGTSVEHIKDLPAAGELVGRLWRECEAARSNRKSALPQDCSRS